MADGSSARAEEADEGRLGGLNHRATPGVGKAHPVFLRKKCPRSSSYHIGNVTEGKARMRMSHIMRQT